VGSFYFTKNTWTRFAHNGYGLANLATEFGIVFQHHAALEDARVAGELLVRAIQDTGISLDDWFVRVEKPIFGETSKGSKISKEGDPRGPMFGEEVVFTGALSIPRRQAAELAAQTGCNVSPSVTQSTTILIVGQQDIRRLAGQEKSSKHRKAEELVRKGQQIRILGEQDFFSLIGK
jgi:DNA polymerase-3 subunit epsilon